MRSPGLQRPSAPGKSRCVATLNCISESFEGINKANLDDSFVRNTKHIGHLLTRNGGPCRQKCANPAQNITLGLVSILKFNSQY